MKQKRTKRITRRFDNYYVSDFETTTPTYSSTETKAYLLAISSVEAQSEDEVEVFYTIEDYMKYIKNNMKIDYISFHNAGFDTTFIESYLLFNGFTYTDDKPEHPNTFTELRDDKNTFYSLTIRFDNDHLIQIEDSLKLANMKLEALSKKFSPNYIKQSVDLDLILEQIDNIKDNQELISYVKRDVFVLVNFYKIQLENGLPKATLASLSLNEYKQHLLSKNLRFKNLFPTLSKAEDEFVRKAYSGGITQVKPGYENIEIKQQIKSFDINSLYPYVLETCYLPTSKGMYYRGQPHLDFTFLTDYSFDPKYLTVLHIKIKDFYLKENCLPTLKSKTFFNHEVKYLTSGDELELYITDIDFYWLTNNYSITEIIYIDYIRYKTSKDLFASYINIQKEKKIKAKTPAERQIAKDRQNSLYGKFGTNPSNAHKIPKLNEEGVIERITVRDEDKKTIYIPIATFTTAYARNTLLQNIRKNYDYFLYCDTDSIYLIDNNNIILPIDSQKYGYFKHEHTLSKATFIKPKLYKGVKGDTDPDILQNPDSDRFYFRAAGIQQSSKINTITYDNLKIGAKFKQLYPKMIKGGIILITRYKEIL